MTIRMKRKIVLEFKAGETRDACSILVWNAISRLYKDLSIKDCRYYVEQILRDFMNGEFRLEKKR